MRRRALFVLAVVVGCASGLARAADSEPDVKWVSTLGAAGGAHVLQAGLQEAAAVHAPVCVVVLDATGRMDGSRCMDGVAAGAMEGAMAKARHSVHFRSSTKDFETALNLGATELLVVPGLVPVDGGEPVTANGAFVGAVGVAGAAPDVDGRIARAAAAAIARDH